jgi:hypothetical protein
MSGNEEHRFVLLKKMTERKNGRLLDISVVPFFENFFPSVCTNIGVPKERA